VQSKHSSACMYSLYGLSVVVPGNEVPTSRPQGGQENEAPGMQTWLAGTCTSLNLIVYSKAAGQAVCNSQLALAQS
jgi:hypothetical protein